jgi:hypothetical protein
MQDNNNYQREEIFSKRVPAGKRTYFFDVKSTKSNDYYLTITESKKRIGEDGAPFYEKHKIFLYREDFEKFMEGMNESVNRVRELRPEGLASVPAMERTSSPEQTPSAPTPPSTDGTSFSDVSFEDLK